MVWGEKVPWESQGPLLEGGWDSVWLVRACRSTDVIPEPPELAGLGEGSAARPLRSPEWWVFTRGPGWPPESALVALTGSDTQGAGEATQSRGPLCAC